MSSGFVHFSKAFAVQDRDEPQNVEHILVRGALWKHGETSLVK